jgi:predicted outer membrane lipoprotein
MSCRRVNRRTLIASVLLGIAILACIYGAISLAWSPYTDQQVRSSLVDTWGAEAMLAAWLLGALIGCFAIAVWLRLRSRDARDRVASLLAVVFTLGGVGLVFASHVVLTMRVARLTGQTFGALYGLL